MRNLIFLFIKYGGFIVFFFLEVLCMFLVVRYNPDQNKIFLSSSNLVSGYLYTKVDDVAKFITLSSVADSLAEENALLLAQMKNARFVETVLRDTSRQEESLQQFSFLAASVKNNSINRLNNTLTINRGSYHGVSPRMGVLSPGGGVIGIVLSTSNRFSTVLSILHKESKISAKVKRNGFYGSLVWEGSNPNRVQLEAIPKHADLVIGDSIVTSGYSAVFPEDILIGKIDTFWLEKGSNFYTIELSLANDLSKVKYVYVVDNLFKEEQLGLEEEVSDE